MITYLNKKVRCINKKICLIVAHYDDESLFFGGLLNELNTTNIITIIIIVDISYQNINSNYMKKLENFKNIMNLLNIKYIELNFSNIKIQTEFCNKIISLQDNIIKYNENINTKKKEFRLKQEEFKVKKEEFRIKQEEFNREKEKFEREKEEFDREKEKFEREKEKFEREKEKFEIKKKEIILLKSQDTDKLKLLYNKRITYIQELKIDREEHKEIFLNIEKQLKELKLEDFDIFLTHNKYGEYGNYQHKIVHEVVKNLKQTILSDKVILTTANTQTNIYINVNKSLKQKMLKMYDFKDTDEHINIWFNQCIKNYPFWADNNYEYFEIME